MKSCNKCGEAKPLDEFYNLRASKDGKQNTCKKCQNENTARRRKEKLEETRAYQREYGVKYRGERSEYLREYQRNYRKENCERLREKRLKWLDENREYMREYFNKYYLEHMDEIKENHREYYLNNPDVFRHSRRVRRERMRGSEVTITKEQESEIYRRFGHKCALTGREGNLHLDHFIPVAVGGTTSVENMVPIAGELNISKHANNPFEWVERRKDVPQDSFDRIVLYLAQLNGLTVNEYREFVYAHFEQNKNKHIS